jgi:hypothetical protein
MLEEALNGCSGEALFRGQPMPRSAAEAGAVSPGRKEDSMFCCAKRAVMPGLALALLAGPAAFAAPEEEKPEIQQKQAPDGSKAYQASDDSKQPPDDSKAYLPPWMQKPAGVTVKAADKGGEPAAADVPADPAAKQKPAGQKPPRRHREGFFNFFWR